MPKIIDEAREKILHVSKQKLLSEGYSSLSLRSIAKECSIAVGTIYNYFENKDTLIAHIMIEDWTKALQKMDEGCQNAASVSEGVISIYHAIESFSEIYQDVWNQFSRTGGSADVVSGRHGMLRNQLVQRLALLLERLCPNQGIELLPLFAETVLIAARQPDIDISQIVSMSERLFPEESLSSQSLSR